MRMPYHKAYTKYQPIYFDDYIEVTLERPQPIFMCSGDASTEWEAENKYGDLCGFRTEIREIVADTIIYEPIDLRGLARKIDPFKILNSILQQGWTISDLERLA